MFNEQEVVCSVGMAATSVMSLQRDEETLVSCIWSPERRGDTGLMYVVSCMCVCVCKCKMFLGDCEFFTLFFICRLLIK